MPLLQHRHRHHPSTTRSRRPRRATLTATAVSASEIDLTWGAATDNVGVTGYRVERCQGAGCSNFTQIGTSPATTLQRHRPHRRHQLQLPRARHRRRRQPRPLLEHRQRDHPRRRRRLVAAYAFDEGSGTTVADSSGNGNNGTVANATWTATGKFGQALVFNGTSTRVTVPDSPSLHLTTG